MLTTHHPSIDTMHLKHCTHDVETIVTTVCIGRLLRIVEALATPHPWHLRAGADTSTASQRPVHRQQISPNKRLQGLLLVTPRILRNHEENIENRPRSDFTPEIPLPLEPQRVESIWRRCAVVAGHGIRQCYWCAWQDEQCFNRADTWMLAAMDRRPDRLCSRPSPHPERCRHRPLCGVESRRNRRPVRHLPRRRGSFTRRPGRAAPAAELSIALRALHIGA